MDQVIVTVRDMNGEMIDSMVVDGWDRTEDVSGRFVGMIKKAFGVVS